MNHNSPTLPIDAIDYDLAARAYHSLAWRWSAAANGCPNAAEIARAIRLAASGLRGPDDLIASGGYFVTNTHGEPQAGFDRKLQSAMDAEKARGAK